jgi:dTMP kinase
VLLDRFVDSSLAYQGGGRGLDVDAVRELNRFATAGLTPDRTLLLRLDPAVGLTRVGKRLEGFDRLERERLDFWSAVTAAYDELAAADPARWAVIDATQTPERVLAEALAAIVPTRAR